MPRHTRLLATLVVATLFVLLGAHTAIAQPPRAQWTLLMYLAANNDLEGDTLANLEQMAMADSSPSVNVVVQISRDPTSDITDPIFNLQPFTTTKRLLVQHGSFRELRDLGEIDSGDPRTLTSFITWGMTNYPAQHYMLDISDHGNAWQGCCEDDQSGSSMDLPAIAGALRSANTKVDILGFDACLMASLEVATELQPFAGLLAASEEEEPGNGWNYTAFLSALARSPSMSATDLAAAIADTYMAGLAADAPELAQYATFSVTDLMQIDTVDGVFAGFVEAVNSYINDGTRDNLAERLARFGQVFAQAGIETPSFGSEGPRDPGTSLDLGLLATNASTLSGSGSVQQAASRLQSALNGAVVHNTTGDGYGIAHLSGLSIATLAQGDTHADDVVQYGQLADAASSPWLQLVRGFDRSIAAAGTDAVPTISPPRASAATIAPGGRATVSGQVSDSALVTDVEVLVATRLSGKRVILRQDKREDHLSRTVNYDFTFDGMGWFIREGDVDEPIYSESWRPGQRLVFGSYRQNPREDPTDAYFVVDERSGRLLQGFDANAAKLVGSLRPGSQSSFIPYVLDARDESTFIPLKRVMVKRAYLAREALPAGAYEIITYGENISGNSDEDSVTITATVNERN